MNGTGEAQVAEPSASSGSKWAKWLGIGCGSLIALALVGVLLLNWGVKRLVVGKIESELESQGWRADVGDFDYSIANKEVEIRNFTGVPMDAKQMEEVGEVYVDHARVRFDNSREDKLGELELRGAKARFGQLDEIKLVPEKSISVKGFIINNPEEFGGGALLDFKEIELEYGDPKVKGREHFQTVLIDVARLNIVKNKQGLWLTDLTPKAQETIRKNDDSPTVSQLTIRIGEIAFQDLLAGGEPKVITMNRTIKVENNPKDYALGVFLQLVGIVSEAKRQSGY
tara:strand:+ start:475 stop:1326 length:852 start_codon:yes stop_codon:yes gene_type:complete